MGMRVWVDQDMCTGDGLCEETCATSFTVGDDGLAYAREDGQEFGMTRVFGLADGTAGGFDGQARVPAGWEAAAIEAAETCPGECIFIEVED